MKAGSDRVMGDNEGRRSEHDSVALAAHLRGAAIELLLGRELESERLARLLEAAATALLDHAEQRPVTPSSPGAERLVQIKERHQRAYERWTAEDDESLRQQHAEGRSTEELAEAFQRQPSAIRARLQRLGLESPGGQAQ
jgi:DNA-directed RNA polymerase specialized sigma24 family protein